jgi:hypothetical protein
MSPPLPGEGDIIVETRHRGVIAINGVRVVWRINGSELDPIPDSRFAISYGTICGFPI